MTAASDLVRPPRADTSALAALLGREVGLEDDVCFLIDLAARLHDSLLATLKPGANQVVLGAELARKLSAAVGQRVGELAQQLHAVESAIANAKRELIHDHIEHCLGEDVTGPSAVSTRPGSEDFVQSLQDLVKNKLSQHEYPRQVAFVPELPKTPAGKVHRKVLRDREAAVLAVTTAATTAAA